jgi:charged multivesicular body protein 3
LLSKSAATVKAVGHIQKSSEVMKLVNGLLKAPEVAATMQELSKEMMKV